MLDKPFLSIVRYILRWSCAAVVSEKGRKKIGRPTKAPAPGAKVSLGLKVTAEIKECLTNASAFSGRTQSQEAEYRLEQSFDHRPLHAAVELAFGRELGGMVVLIGQCMALTRDLPKLFDVNGAEPWIYDQMVKAAHTILETFRPPGEVVQPQLPRYSTAGLGADRPRVSEDALNALNAQAEALLNAGVEVATQRLSELTATATGVSDAVRDLMGDQFLSRAATRKDE